MALSIAQRVYNALDKGKTTEQIVAQLKGEVTTGTVAAYRANWTRKNQSSMYEVQGTFIIEAPSKEEAMALVAPRRNTSTTSVIDANLQASRLTSSQAAQLNG